MSCNPQLIETVAGSDVDLACTYTGDDGEPLDLTGYQIASQIRTDSGALVGTLTAEITDAAAGEYSLTAAADDTEGWHVGLHWMDVRYTSGSQRRHTERARFRVSPAVTRDDSV